MIFFYQETEMQEKAQNTKRLISYRNYMLIKNINE